MVQLVEITGVLNEKGCIEIPIVLLAQTGIRTGEEVNLIYLAAGEKDYRNESREFMLKRAEEDPLEALYYCIFTRPPCDASERNQSEQEAGPLNRQEIYPHQESQISFPQRYPDEPLGTLCYRK